MLDEFTELIAMDKSTNAPSAGDIFVVQPKHNYYYFAKVIQTNIQGSNLNFKGMNLIYVYNCHGESLEAPAHLDEYKLLLPPTVVNKSGWKNGYFKTVGHQAVTALERSIDFGFFDNFDRKENYFGLHGDKLQHVPRYSDFNGLSSYRTIGREMHKILFGKKYL